MMPNELFDAARVEGVKEWRIFLFVALPLARPTLAALSIILFLAQLEQLSLAAADQQPPGDDDRAGGARQPHRPHQGLLGWHHGRRRDADGADAGPLRCCCSAISSPAFPPARSSEKGRQWRVFR